MANGRLRFISFLFGVLVLTSVLGVSPAFADGGQGALMAGSAEGLSVQADQEAGETVDVLRLFNPRTGEHFYTLSAAEKRDLVGKGWRDEGMGWTAPKVSGSPVWRLFNPVTGDHHYTLNASERSGLLAGQWRDEGIGWYSPDADQPRVALYREFHPSLRVGAHHYTLYGSEHNAMASWGWRPEGIGWYAVPTEAQQRDGWIQEGGRWHRYAAGNLLRNQWYVTVENPAFANTYGHQRYWLDAAGDVAFNRLVDPASANDGNAQFLAFATPEGYVVRGKRNGGSQRLYLADGDGRLETTVGWLVTAKYDGRLERYYMDGTSRAARTGHFTVAGQNFQADENLGYVTRNQFVSLDGTWYYADNGGVLTADAVVNRLVARAQAYSSPSRYLIMVDIDNPRTIVFEGSRGRWNVKFIWDCCTGAPSTPTVQGVFSVAMKGYSFGENHGYSCYHWTQFYGNYLFHTRKYYPYSRTLLDGRMGERVSEGCVRLYDEDALWIKDNVPVGTTVVTTV